MTIKKYCLVLLNQLNPNLWNRSGRMEFSTAPIAALDDDDSSLSNSKEFLYTPFTAFNGVIKRSLSDPFDIAVGINLEASLEHLIWTFDDDVVSNSHNTHDKNEEIVKEKKAKREANLSAIKEFWRISQLPIDNPMETYPLEHRPIFYEMADIHMADADSVSEARSKESGLNLTDHLSALSSDPVERVERSDDDTVATNSVNPHSVSETSSLSSSPAFNGFTEDPMALRVSPLGLEPFDVPSCPPGVISSLHGENEDEHSHLDDSLRSAELQAGLEAFKARHPTLPMVRTDAWCQDLSQLSSALLTRYSDELLCETSKVSEILITLLAEREELILFREIEDDFVVLHNAVQVRRRRAAEAVLTSTTQSILFRKKTARMATGQRVQNGVKTGSLIELVNLPPELKTRTSLDDIRGQRTISGNSYAEQFSCGNSLLRVPETSERKHGSRNSVNSVHSVSGDSMDSRCPRGHRIGEPIEVPALMSLLSRLGTRVIGSSNRLSSENRSQIEEELLIRIAGEEQEARAFQSPEMLEILQLAKNRGRRKHAGTLPSPYLPWPSGRPECSQTLRLLVPLPTDGGSEARLPLLLPLVNQIFQASLQESSSVPELISELVNFDPIDAVSRQSGMASRSLLAANGFEAADAGFVFPITRKDSPTLRQSARKNVKFDWRGTKEPFRELAGLQHPLI